jgi:adenine-specific DNA-methyltransferase
MAGNISQKLQTLLLQNEKYLAKDANDKDVLNKTLVSDDARKYDEELLGLLQSDEDIKAHFFTRLDNGIHIFKLNNFLTFINNREFLPDSFTAYKNRIGLATDADNYLFSNRDVVLNWAYKDCVLEGGQSKDDQKRSEVFFNETLAPDQINRLLDDKVFVNWKRYDEKGEHTIDELQKNDNLIIKGNNLVVLHSLKKRFAGKVKLIYIDPPYNTGNDSFGYNDRFNHSTWLTFMKNRLEVARELLREDGVIFVHCDDNEQAYLKVLMDEIFKRENFVNTLVWHKKNVVQNDAKYFNENHDYMVVFAKNKFLFVPNLLARTNEMNARYSNPDNDPRGEWTSVALTAKSGSNIYELTFPNGVFWKPNTGVFPRLSKESLLKAYEENRLWFGKDGKNVPRLKKYLSEVKDGLIANTIFANGETGSTQQAKEEVKKILGDNVFATPKPESLIERIVELATSQNDLVLDYHLGSGTTAAVAHKMGRQYIGVEQMDYIETVSVERLKKVIEGEQGGISKSQNWQGGGSFVYCELANDAQNFRNEVKTAPANELNALFEKAQNSSFLSARINKNKEFNGFENLSENEKRELLCELVDANTLYVNYADMESADYQISEADKALNKQFYGEER